MTNSRHCIEQVDILTRGMLLANGFERYKRHWRKRHDDLDERTNQN